MILNDLLKESCFASNGTIRNQDELEMSLRYFLYNKDFLSKFPLILYSLNGETEFMNKFYDEIKKELPSSNINVIFSENLGHTFGIFLSELNIFQYLYQNKDIKWVWKFSNDVICTSDIFQCEIEKDNDMYYINNIGYNSFVGLGHTIESLFKAIKDKTYFYPQTNYYIVKNGIEFYPDLKTTYELKQQYVEFLKTHPNTQPWHAIPKCDCENMLIKTVENNKLKYSHILNDEELLNIIHHIYTSKQMDGSHKNIAYKRLGNLCHYQFVNDDILEL